MAPASTTDTVAMPHTYQAPGQPMAPVSNVSLITSSSPLAASEAGQPMAPASTGDTVAMPHTYQAPGQPMAPESNVSSGSGQPMALLSATTGPSGLPMAPLSCSPMAQGTTTNASSTPSVIRLRLPSSLDSQKPEVFEAVVGLKCTLPEIGEGLERSIVETLIGELNNKFLAGLDSNFSTCRDEEANQTLSERIGDSFIVVGSSHAHRIAEALRRQGDTVTSLADPTWRLTEENVATLASSLKTAVSDNPSATVILQLYDSSVYYSSTGPGERSLPRRGQDGHYHVPGDLVMADWPSFKQIFASSLPLIRAGGELKKILLSPLPRYVMGRCCTDSGHLKNFGTKEYVRAMGNTLGEIDDWIRDLAFSKRILNFSVINTGTLVDLDSPSSKKKELIQWWGNDPIHMTEAGYAKLARNLTVRIDKIREQEEAELDNQPKRRKLDPPHSLPGRVGISRSDTAARRHADSGAPASRTGNSRRDGKIKRH